VQQQAQQLAQQQVQALQQQAQQQQQQLQQQVYLQELQVCSMSGYTENMLVRLWGFLSRKVNFDIANLQHFKFAFYSTRMPDTFFGT
jgi:hypothetical protein